LKLKAPDSKMRQTDCANTEGIFRLIQSILDRYRYLSVAE